ncbi:uncharacterized protein LOC127263974 [Andrographis paniculata]|uniref:uncharacterized protein LOC127263974 n=1 Tax=Andrographis paniculata TaxID=175694 RepID=UPI0021E8B737|nr:uncharacterized protein LOC127263974 [Andrographis paniculata]
MIFATRDEVKRAIQSHAIAERRSVAFTKIDKRRLYARCKEPNCECKINAMKVKDDTAFQVSLLHPKHSESSLPSLNVANVKTSWLSETFAHKFKCDPKREVRGFRKEIMRELNVSVSKDQAYRAKRRALERISGDLVYQYSRLWDYAHELRKSNPGTTIVLDVETDDEESIFDRIYVCYGALKKGFSVGCRAIIGVDGCHLKGIYAGVLLTAVGIDPNNNLFPIAFAVVSRENGETWRWFLTLLKKDLRIGGDKQVTFMSDKQKGLIQAFDVVFPGYYHIFCVRHMHNNFFNAGFRGTALKNTVWRAALPSTPGEFRRRMDELKDLDSEAHKWFGDKPVAQWSRSHFKVYSKCDILLNNVCERFNSAILDAREQPILSMLESIRQYLMKMLQTNRDMAACKWKNLRFCPNALKLLEGNVRRVSDCIPIKSDNTHYEISCFDGSQHAINLRERTCTCRQWQLSGIPCKHAISAISNQREEIQDYIDEYYSVETYIKVYAPAIMAVTSDLFWEVTGFNPPEPPTEMRSVGRPTSSRRRERDEPVRKTKKKARTLMLKKNQMTVRCR